MEKLDLFTTPSSWPDLLDWMFLNPKDDWKDLFQVIIHSYNQAIERANTLQSDEENELPYLNHVQRFLSHIELYDWIGTQPKSNQRLLSNAAAMSWNLAVDHQLNSTMSIHIGEMNKRTFNDIVEAYLFPALVVNPNEDVQTQSTGYIYILARDSGKIVKIGETKRDPRARGQEYINEYNLQGFSFYKAFKVPSEARQEIEKLAHNALIHQRLTWDNTSGAREIFECDVEQAEDAVREAIKKSKIAKIEQKNEIDRQLQSRAKFRFNEQCDAFVKDWISSWETSDEALELEQKIAKFQENNSFEKLGERNILHHFSLLIGWFFMILAPLPALRQIFDPISSSDYLSDLVLCIVYAFLAFCLGKFFHWLSRPLVPDDEKINSLNSLKKYRSDRQTEELLRAKQQFNSINSVDQFM